MDIGSFLRMACGAAGVVSVLAAAPAAAATDKECTGTLTGEASNVIVPAGASCTLSGARVKASVTVRAGASLLIDGRQLPSTVDGSVQAVNCKSALLLGGVTVKGSVQIVGCSGASGFNGPGVVIGASFQCINNSGPCSANFGQVGGSVQLVNNRSTTASSISQTAIAGSLQCVGNAPGPAATYGPGWQASLQGQCSAATGFVGPAARPSCAQLATDSRYGFAGNPAIASVTSTVVAATQTNAAYCNVQLTYSALAGPANGYAPGQSQAIRIGIGLPLNTTDGGNGGVQGAWNGKLQNLGGGGLVGSVGSTTGATNGGYVGSSTDGGHTTAENGAAGSFGVIQATHELNRGKILDYAIESVHQQFEWSRIAAINYYGVEPARNYWNGCSTGGRQGLALAHYYGDRFDGFLVGAPAFFHEEFRLSDAWPYLMVKEKLLPIGQTLTTAQYTAASNAAIAACQVKNHSGVLDGYLDDPRTCTFDAHANVCGRAGAPAAPNCLTSQQADAINGFWDGPRNALGQRVWHPMERGSAIGVGFANLPGSALQVMAWDHRDLTISPGLLYSNAAAILAAGSPAGAITYADEAALGSNNGTDDLMAEDHNNLGDIDLARNHGAKVIMWHGTSDQLIRWRDAADFYRRAAVRYGGTGKAEFGALQTWFRHFSAPGAFHCGNGLGPAPVLTATAPDSAFGALVDWVEKAQAPARLIARGGSVNPARERPLCPWPAAAVYNGSGSTEVTSSYSCSGNVDADPAALCKMLRTEYRKENTGPLDAVHTGIDPAACAGLN